MTTHEEISMIEKLEDTESFQMWSFQITILFKAHGVWEIVKGEKVFETLTKEDEKTDWVRKDAKAQKDIISTINKKVMVHIMNCKTSREMYKKLCEIYKKDNEQQKCSLLQEFFNLGYEKGTDMSLHISKIENLAHRLKSLEQTIDDEMIISKILATLPENFKHFATAWDSTQKTERNLTNLTSRLIAEEQRLNKNEKEENVAFKTDIGREKKKKEIKCYSCGKLGHFMRNCRNREPCKICKKTNHAEQNCFFRKKETKPKVEQKEKKQEHDSAKVAFLIQNEIKNEDEIDYEFIVDSGASIHMAKDIQLFEKVKETRSNVLVAKKNQSMEALGQGKIESKTCILNDVLYIPDLTKNLLSVNAITEKDGNVTFTKNEVVVTKDDKEILKGQKQKNGLYIIKMQNTSDQSLFVENNKSIEKWHKKLGHLSTGYMKKLINLSTGIDISKEDCDRMNKVCDVCLQAKQARQPFNTVRYRATRPLEIIHTDICGPIDPITWDGNKYFLTILDDFTHYCVVYLLKTKNEAKQYLKEYVEEVEAYHDKKVSKIRCDNGGEYTDTELKQWCKKKGIILDYTVPHTPQLNGKAERLNRTLIEKARALIFDSDSQRILWGEAIRVAAYLLNRSPTETNKNYMTPIQKWTGRIPDLSRLHIFGCEAYMKILDKQKKLEPRSKKHLFVGYTNNAYRLFDEQKQKIIISRDVVFQEEKERNTNQITIRTTTNEEECTEQKDKENQQEENIEEEPNENQLENTENDTTTEDESEESDSDRFQSLGEGRKNGKREVKLPKKYNEYVMLTYNEVLKEPDREKWKEAIGEEKEALERNKTWKYVEKPEGKKILTSRWIFKVKSDGRYKARLVVRGCQQKYGEDFEETYSPVVNVTSLRILIALAAKNKYIIKKFDIKTAFLYGELRDEIFITIPEGYEEKPNTVCQLHKALYGLKQSPLIWNQHFSNFLKEFGLKPLNTEKCIFKNQKNNLFLAIYVDDGLIIGDSKCEIEALLRGLEETFEITKYDSVNSFLGIDIKEEENVITLSQKDYTENIIRKFNMENAKPADVPMICNDRSTENITSRKFPYREAIGSLLYLSNKSRPDIAYAVSFGSRKVEKPSSTDISNVKQIFRYLNSTKDFGVCYKRNSECDELSAFSDSDFAGDKETRKSTTGYVVYFCGGPIAWCSRKQPIVSLSSTEAEYIAAAECVKELLYIKNLVEELKDSTVKVILNIDNQSTIKLIKNGQFNRRSKHIEVRYHFINEKVNEGLLKIDYCPSEHQIADVFTKPLGRVKFLKHKDSLVCKI